MNRIVHLGLGNFHRAHQAVYTQLADDGWQITGVANRSRHVVDALRKQRMRYTVVTIDGDEVRVDPVESITEALVAADDPDTVLARIADPGTRIVSLTITESGYTPDGAMLGLLGKGLQRRAASGGGPLTLLSCDNLAANGDVLRSILVDTVRSADVQDYLGSEVAFPSTMVDRIVPRTTQREITAARSAGYEDEIAVPAEPFRQWVLQPRFAAGRPAWESAGAVFDDDVHSWETVKVRLLNGTHSLIAYLGLLRGHRLIAQAFADPLIRAAADALGEEYTPTLHVPLDLDLAGYRVQLGTRFANAALAHRTEQVGTDGSLKLVQRVPEPARWHLSRGQVPSALALLVAAYVHCFARAVELAGSPTDPAAERLRALGSAYLQAADLAREAVGELFGAAFAEHPEFVDRTATLLDLLDQRGSEAAVGEALS